LDGRSVRKSGRTGNAQQARKAICEIELGLVYFFISNDLKKVLMLIILQKL